MTNKEWLFAKPSLEIKEMMDECPPPFQGRSCVDVNSTCVKCWAKWLDDEHKEPLKPCPFCGNRAIILFDVGDDPPSYYMGCHICGARTALFFTRGEAENAWNRREKDAD